MTGSESDRCAVPVFHLQVAALSIETGTNLTCHLSQLLSEPCKHTPAPVLPAQYRGHEHMSYCTANLDYTLNYIKYFILFMLYLFVC